MNPTYDGTSPQSVFDAASSLCSTKMRAYYMTGVLVQVFRQLFSSPSGCEEPTLRDVAWAADASTGIAIESITRWLPGQDRKRPAIVIRRNACELASLGINDQLMGFGQSDGVDYYAAMMSGGHTLFCLGDEAGEAERLAAEVYRTLAQFGPELRSSFQLTRFKLTGIDQLHTLSAGDDGEATDGYAVPVNVAYSFEESWVLRPHAPILKRISLSSVVDQSA